MEKNLERNNRYSEDLDYLNDENRIMQIKREKERVGISPEKRNFLNKTLNSKVNLKSWSSEYREHMIYRVIYALVSPYPPRKVYLANKLGIHPVILNRLIQSPEYIRIKNELRKDLRSKWGANIDQVVIRQALNGSKYHADLFYKLQGELVDRLEVTKKDDIPENPDDRKKMIERYLDELEIKR